MAEGRGVGVRVGVGGALGVCQGGLRVGFAAGGGVGLCGAGFVVGVCGAGFVVVVVVEVGGCGAR